jgi:N-acetylglucosaminyldiphosphoundecaprenol N-acetyl-beta-D-mannosaminyltransferase
MAETSFASGPDAAGLRWPIRLDVLGVRVSAAGYSEAAEVILRAAKQRTPALVDHLSLHGLSLAQRDPAFREMLEAFDLVGPDGQPVRWALNRLYGAGLADRLYGPELMDRLCALAARERLGIYLYGGHPEVSGRLRRKLLEHHPRLRIVGCESPPFGELSEVDAALVDRINSSGAGIVFLGLGCPKQERFAHAYRGRIRAVQICVGAAFDFLACEKPMAPSWMQARGLEWLFRLGSEPRRLWKRYLVSTPGVAARLALQLARPGTSATIAASNNRGQLALGDSG